jgi:hypothetical protein
MLVGKPDGCERMQVRVGPNLDDSSIVLAGPRWFR